MTSINAAEYMVASFEDKLAHTQDVIAEWYSINKGKVYIAFSGGKDSTVLLHIVRNIYPDVVAVFANTGLEYPEIVKFALSHDNVQMVRPIKSFRDILLNSGFPITNKRTAKALRTLRCATKNNFRTRRAGLIGYISRSGEFHTQEKIAKKWFHLIGSDISVTEECCECLKKDPARLWRRSNPGFVPYVGMMMGEGKTRDNRLLKRECNVFESATPSSIPLKFWTDKDVWHYVEINSVEICSVYKDYNLTRTGCTFCAYGAELEKGENRFEKLRVSHPKLFNYFIYKLGMNKALDYARISYGDEPTHTPPGMLTYTCSGCRKKFPLNKIGFILERSPTKKEIQDKAPLMGMIKYCRKCALEKHLPVMPERI